jgi:uncharacterized NAD-dependent epimerase/dehydratase family protein
MMTTFPEGYAIIYCEGAFRTPNGKTAHGLVRRTSRYRVLSVVDSTCAGSDAGRLLDDRDNGVSVYHDMEAAVEASKAGETPATHFVMGLAPDGGRLSAQARSDVLKAIEMGLHIDSGLHDFLSDAPDIAELASKRGVAIRDIRKCPPINELHTFTGKIEDVTSMKVAVLGTDSAVGKRTTAWLLVDALQAEGFKAELIGTGQTAWFQGVRYGLLLDALVNDFVSGEIEHVIWTAWKESEPDVIVIEGQGSLMNPAYPGGFEILAAGRPDVVVIQHAPARIDYDGFPGYPIHPIDKQIHAVELLSGKPVVAITLNHENLNEEEVRRFSEQMTKDTGMPVCDVLLHGPKPLMTALMPHLRR